MKRKIFELIDEKGINKSKWNRWFDGFIVSLIVLSIIAIILESHESLNQKFSSIFRIFEIFTVFIFTIEYLLRVWTADLKYATERKVSARIKFIFSAYGLIDLLAILPFFLPFVFKFDLRFIRILRVFRLLRVFKLNRYTKALKLVGSVCNEKRSELAVTAFVTIILILMSSTVMYYVENEVQPDKFPNIVSTFWWSIATLTTIGYGDVVPVTGWGKLISGIIALLGIGLVAMPTGIISAAFIEKVGEEKEEESDYKYCPHCGELLN